MFESTVESQQRVISAALSELNVCKPGKVVSYDPETNRAVVRPDLPKAISDGEAIEPPNIFECPVVFSFANVGGQLAGLTFPLKPGDGVMLLFSDRSLENWLSGSAQAPDDPRQFDLSDCIALPGLNPAGVKGDGENVRLFYGEAALSIMPTGAMVFDAPGGVKFNTPKAEFSQEITSPLIKVAGKELAEHKHAGVQSGAAQTGPNING